MRQLIGVLALFSIVNFVVVHVSLVILVVVGLVLAVPILVSVVCKLTIIERCKAFVSIIVIAIVFLAKRKLYHSIFTFFIDWLALALLLVTSYYRLR